MFRKRMLAVAGLFALCGFLNVSVARAANQSPRTPSRALDSVRGLLEEDLRASGIDDPAELLRYREAFEARFGEIVEKIGRSQSMFRRAWRLHAALHEKVLHRYNPTADGFDAVLDRGEYNCVSATLLYGLVARALGLDPQVIESPRHIFIRLFLNGRDVDIETTSSRGFDLGRDLEIFRRFVIAYKYATPDEVARNGTAAIFEEFHGIGKPLQLERATSFLWNNTAERALDRGQASKAAAAYLEEFHLNREMAYRSDRIPLYLARAFRMVYEDGLFDEAYRIAAIELEMFPSKTTTRDRFLAAASKRILMACELGAPDQAERILELAESSTTVSSDDVRLEREACPRIAATAVREGDWELARRMAQRFAGVEPDTTEGTRFLIWVENRQLEASTLALEEVCPDPRRTNSILGSGIYGSAAPRH